MDKWHNNKIPDTHILLRHIFANQPSRKVCNPAYCGLDPSLGTLALRLRLVFLFAAWMNWDGCGRKGVLCKILSGTLGSHSHPCRCCKPAVGHTVRGSFSNQAEVMKNPEWRLLVFVNRLTQVVLEKGP